MEVVSQALNGSILSAPLDESNATDLARGFAALADPARLRLFSLIAAQPGGEVCACALVEPLGRSQPTVSHHLRVLYEAGLVAREKRGTWVWYRPVPGRLETLRAALAAKDQVAVLDAVLKFCRKINTSNDESCVFEN